MNSTRESKRTNGALSILVTGFEPHEEQINASQVLVESLRDNPPQELSETGCSMHYAILPADPVALSTRLIALLKQHRLDILLLTGQAPTYNRVTLEEIAINRIFDEAINASKREAFFASLPHMRDTVRSLKQAEIPAKLSRFAGVHVCNQSLYLSLQFFEEHGLHTKCGLMHIPITPWQVVNEEKWITSPFMPLATSRRAIGIVLRAALEALNTESARKTVS
jgi:pyroglutamyl-peptidase